MIATIFSILFSAFVVFAIIVAVGILLTIVGELIDFAFAPRNSSER